MRAIYLLPVAAPGLGEPAPSIGLLDALAAALARVFLVSCRVRTEALDAGATHEPGRRQFHATAILRALALQAPDPETRLVGVAEFDLFVPVLTFVFGEAQLRGNCGLVSLHRLREEFYGLPPNPELAARRLTVEALHELGHTFGLRHCSDWQCAMASAHTVGRLDLKLARYCAVCRQTLSGSV